jgi:hypothetical protein
MNMKKIVGMVTMLLWTIFAIGQDTQETKGAKSFFGDPTSGVKFLEGVAPKTEPETTSVAKRKSSPAQPVKTDSAVTVSQTGLKYWIDLIQPTGEIQKVNAARGFHSGEKIRLHFESNVNGRLTIQQKQGYGNEPFLQLYPDARINNGDNRIYAYKDTVIPSANADITFDDKPGVERLLVTIDPESSNGLSKPNVQDSPNNHVNVAELQDNGCKGLALEVGIGKCKGLIIEVDGSDTYIGTQVENISAQGNPSAVTLRSIMVEIVLAHQK